MHRDVSRPFDHDLAVALPGELGQLAERLQFGELRLVVGVGDRPGPEPVADEPPRETIPVARRAVRGM
jgi:hypothetical protein